MERNLHHAVIYQIAFGVCYVLYREMLRNVIILEICVYFEFRIYIVWLLPDRLLARNLYTQLHAVDIDCKLLLPRT